MSGVYLTVWDAEKPFDRVLQPTKGGWPHITVAYTGSHLTEEELRDFGSKLFEEVVMQKPAVVTSAYVNSFQLGNGEWRHDCLLKVDDDTTARVTAMRETLEFDHPDKYAKFSTNPPHITVGIHADVASAQAQVDSINEMLPITVDITGISID